MLRILDLSWRRLVVVEAVRPTISRLRDATVTADRLPIVVDASTRSSALVLTNVLDWAQLHLSLPETSSSVDTGLWDIIRKNQMEVHQDQPASLVAQMASETETGVVHVVNDNGIPVGLFVPHAVQERLIQNELIGEMDLHLTQTSGPDELRVIIDILDSRFDEFRDESLNYIAPTILVCHSKPAHVVKRCPCKQHRAPCS
jgi:hypothetical protein